MDGWLKQSTAVTLLIGPFTDDTDGNTAETGLTVSQADVRLSKNGGNMAQKNSATACTHDELGMYTCPLDTTDTNTLGILVLTVHESGSLVVKHTYMVLPSNVWDSFFGADKLDVSVVQWLGTACATPTVAGVPEVDVTHMEGGTQTVTDLKDFADAGYDPATNKVQGVVLVDTTTANTDLVSAASIRTEIDSNSTQLAALVAAVITNAAGVDISADILTIDNLVDDLESRLTAARAGYLDNLNIAENVAGTSEIAALNDPTAAAIADAVFDEATAGHVAAGSFGKLLADILTDTNAILVDTGTTLQAELDAIQAAVITNAAGADVAADIIALKAVADAILVDTGTTIPATLGTPAAASLAADILAIDNFVDGIPADVWDLAGAIDGYTPREIQRLVAAAVLGKASGLATTTAVYRAADDSKTRITATVDADGNRSAVTLVAA
jgi:hypothetical protein